MKPRIIYIHGNQVTHWSLSWASWLKQELEKNGYATFFETFPDSIIARSEYWLPFLKDYAKASENDVLVGWSTGAVAALRYAQSNKILGSILISPSYTDLGDEMEKQSGYFTTPWDWQSIKQNQRQTALFYGDDDPYIPQKEFQFIAQQLESKTVKIAGGKHFIERQTFPELLGYLFENYS